MLKKTGVGNKGDDDAPVTETAMHVSVITSIYANVCCIEFKIIKTAELLLVQCIRCRQ